MRTQRQIYIANTLKHDGVSKASIDFLLELITLFKVTDTLQSTSKKLAAAYGKSERSIQRYVRELSHNFDYIHITNHWNTDNPDKPYIYMNTYKLTSDTQKILDSAEGYSKRDVNVHFRPGVTT